MTIITYEDYFDFYALTNYDDDKGGYYDTKDTLCVQWRVDSERRTGQLHLILWDDFHDKEFEVWSDTYSLDELTPEKCEAVYKEELHNLFFTQDEDYFQIIEDNYDEWKSNLKREPDAEDFQTVTRLEGFNADTWEYVALP